MFLFQFLGFFVVVGFLNVGEVVPRLTDFFGGFGDIAGGGLGGPELLGKEHVGGECFFGRGLDEVLSLKDFEFCVGEEGYEGFGQHKSNENNYCLNQIIYMILIIIYPPHEQADSRTHFPLPIYFLPSFFPYFHIILFHPPNYYVIALENNIYFTMYNSYGSSYGSGYSSLSGYGSYGSYGGYGGYRGLSSNSYQNNRTEQDQQNNPENNIRKQTMKEYFQMMDGFRSLVSIGFALAHLGRLTSFSWDLLKKVVAFFAKTSNKIIQKLLSFLPLDLLSAKLSSVKTPQTVGGKFYLLARVLGVILLMVGLKVRRDFTKEVEEEHNLILEEYKEELGQMDELPHQKEGYF